MNEFFQLCVDIIKYISSVTGYSYEEVNIYLFVIIHPIITIVFYMKYFKYKLKYKTLKNIC